MPVNSGKQSWPGKLKLNGSDYFQILLDRHYRQHSPQGNVSRFAVTVTGKIDVKQFESDLNRNELACWLHSLRLKRRLPFLIPYWKQTCSTSVIPLHVHDATHPEQPIPPHLFATDIRPETDPPFRLDLIYQADHQTIILLTWSHILMDAQGAEALIHHLGDAIQNNPIQFLAQEETPLPFSLQAQHARKIRDFMFHEQEIDVALLTKKTDKESANRYHLIRFSEAETAQITARGQHLGIRLGRSPFLLAATMRSFHELLQQKNIPCHNFYVPIPQNQRKKGILGPIVGNQVSFLFYRLLPDHLKDIQTAVDTIGQQMINQMRAGIPASFSMMMMLMRRLPLWLYSRIIKSPTKGTLSSFFFSDTGKTLDEFTHFYGQPVSDAVHYPPNSSHPGFTFIFMNFQKMLHVMIAYTDSHATTKDLSIFENALRKNLFG